MAKVFLNPKVLPLARHPDALVLHPHTQRTGGNTMLHQVFAAVYGPQHVYSRMLGAAPPVWRKLDDARLEGIRVLCDHFVFCGRTKVTRPLLPVAVLRHPLYRAVSLYHFVRRKMTHDDHALARALDLEAFHEAASARNPRYYRNLQCRRLCGEPDARMALERIDEAFLGAGFTEELDTFVAALGTVLGWPGLDIRRAVPDAERYDAQVTPSFRARVLADNEEDLLLFETIAKGPPHGTLRRGVKAEARTLLHRAQRRVKDLVKR